MVHAAMCGLVQGCPHVLIPASRLTRHVPPASPASVLLLTTLRTPFSWGLCMYGSLCLERASPANFTAPCCTASAQTSPPPGAFPPPLHPHRPLSRLRVSAGCLAVPHAVFCVRSFLFIVGLTYGDASSARAGPWASVLPVPGVWWGLRLYLLHDPACVALIILSHQASQ